MFSVKAMRYPRNQAHPLCNATDYGCPIYLMAFYPDRLLKGKRQDLTRSFLGIRWLVIQNSRRDTFLF